MNEEHIGADVAIFVETFEQENNIVLFPKSNYNTFTQIRKDKEHGGIKIVAQSRYQVTELSSSSSEILSIKLNLLDKESTGLLITGVYLKPYMNHQKIQNEFETLR